MRRNLDAIGKFRPPTGRRSCKRLRHRFILLVLERNFMLGFLGQAFHHQAHNSVLDLILMGAYGATEGSLSDTIFVASRFVTDRQLACILNTTEQRQKLSWKSDALLHVARSLEMVHQD